MDWSNRLILGDSLQVMASLAQRENLAGKVQMIYLDPPYGIRFGSNFQPETGKPKVTDREVDLTREPEMVTRLSRYLAARRAFLPRIFAGSTDGGADAACRNGQHLRADWR